MMGIVVYDIEILRAIQRPGEEPLPDIEYCVGFDDHANCGISVLCAFDVGQMLPMVFCADNLVEFQSVIDQAKYVVGFNNRKFDDKVCAANGLIVPPEKSIDLLRNIWIAAGLDPDNYVKETHAGFGLDAVCRMNFGEGKTLTGWQAPIEWQRGNYGKVISYCLHDVILTVRLLQYVEQGLLRHPLTGAKMDVSTLP